MVTADDAPGPGALLAAAGRLDGALLHHDRTAALAAAELLLDALFAHHRALRPVRAGRDPLTAELIETETVSMIALVALAVGQLVEGGRWPDPRFRRNVDEMIEVEFDLGALAVPAGSFSARTRARSWPGPACG
jgi:hypothetical protein